MIHVFLIDRNIRFQDKGFLLQKLDGSKEIVISSSLADILSLVVRTPANVVVAWYSPQPFIAGLSGDTSMAAEEAVKRGITQAEFDNMINDVLELAIAADEADKFLAICNDEEKGGYDSHPHFDASGKNVSWSVKQGMWVESR